MDEKKKKKIALEKAKKVEILKQKARSTSNEKTRKKIGRAISNLQIANKNTKPELRTEKLLRALKIKYEKHVPFCGFEFDFYLPEHKTFIEVNGDYFHANPLKYKKSAMNLMQKKNYKRDVVKMNVAVEKDYRVIYIWETDINKRTGLVKKDIINSLLTETSTFKHGHKHLLEESIKIYADFYKSDKGKKKVKLNESEAPGDNKS